MTRTQQFIVDMKLLHKDMMEEKAKEEDPFETKENRNIAIPKKLKYAEGETKKLRMHKPKEHWYEKNKHPELATNVQFVLGSLEWS